MDSRQACSTASPQSGPDSLPLTLSTGMGEVPLQWLWVVTLKVTRSNPAPSGLQAGHAFIHWMLTLGSRGLLTEPVVAMQRWTLCTGRR